MDKPRNGPQTLEFGARVGSYRVAGPPMRGGFAAVYRCVSEVDGSTAAIKVLHEGQLSTRRAVERFNHEVEAIRRIGHPNIVEVFTQGTLADGRPYYVMEWLDGRSLEDELRVRGPLLPIDALPIMQEIAAALSAAHAAGVVHRDLKPDNIMAVPRKDWLSIRLLDFGIAKLVGANDPRQGLTTTGITIGTVDYMAPEQILCDIIDARTDIYALGVLVYRMVTGELPFRAQSRVAVQMMHLDQPVPDAGERAPAAMPWDDVIRRCMSKAPSDRPQSIDAALAAFRAALAPGSTRAPAAEQLSLQIELAGDADAPAAWNARNYALVRASAWLRAAGWSLVVEADNALVAQATLASGEMSTGQQAALLAAARRFVATFSIAAIPWAQPVRSESVDGPGRFVARAWIRSATTLQPLPAEVDEFPSGVYLARSLASEFQVTGGAPPALTDFVRLNHQEDFSS